MAEGQGPERSGGGQDGRERASEYENLGQSGELAGLTDDERALLARFGEIPADIRPDLSRLREFAAENAPHITKEQRRLRIDQYLDRVRDAVEEHYDRRILGTELSSFNQPVTGDGQSGGRHGRPEEDTGPGLSSEPTGGERGHEAREEARAELREARRKLGDLRVQQVNPRLHKQSSGAAEAMEAATVRVREARERLKSVGQPSVGPIGTAREKLKGAARKFGENVASGHIGSAPGSMATGAPDQSGQAIKELPAGTGQEWGVTPRQFDEFELEPSVAAQTDEAETIYVRGRDGMYRPETRIEARIRNRFEQPSSLDISGVAGAAREQWALHQERKEREAGNKNAAEASRRYENRRAEESRRDEDRKAAVMWRRALDEERVRRDEERAGVEAGTGAEHRQRLTERLINVIDGQELGIDGEPAEGWFSQKFDPDTTRLVLQELQDAGYIDRATFTAERKRDLLPQHESVFKIKRELQAGERWKAGRRALAVGGPAVAAGSLLAWPAGLAVAAAWTAGALVPPGWRRLKKAFGNRGSVMSGVGERERFDFYPIKKEGHPDAAVVVRVDERKGNREPELLTVVRTPKGQAAFEGHPGEKNRVPTDALREAVGRLELPEVPKQAATAQYGPDYQHPVRPDGTPVPYDAGIPDLGHSPEDRAAMGGRPAAGAGARRPLRPPATPSRLAGAEQLAAAMRLDEATQEALRRAEAGGAPDGRTRRRRPEVAALSPAEVGVPPFIELVQPMSDIDPPPDGLSSAEQAQWLAAGADRPEQLDALRDRLLPVLREARGGAERDGNVRNANALARQERELTAAIERRREGLREEEEMRRGIADLSTRVRTATRDDAFDINMSGLPSEAQVRALARTAQAPEELNMIRGLVREREAQERRGAVIGARVGLHEENEIGQLQAQTTEEAQRLMGIVDQRAGILAELDQDWAERSFGQILDRARVANPEAGFPDRGLPSATQMRTLALAATNSAEVNLLHLRVSQRAGEMRATLDPNSDAWLRMIDRRDRLERVLRTRDRELERATVKEGQGLQPEQGGRQLQEYSVLEGRMLPGDAYTEFSTLVHRAQDHDPEFGVPRADQLTPPQVKKLADEAQNLGELEDLEVELMQRYNLIHPQTNIITYNENSGNRRWLRFNETRPDSQERRLLERATRLLQPIRDRRRQLEDERLAARRAQEEAAWQQGGERSVASTDQRQAEEEAAWRQRGGRGRRRERPPEGEGS